MGDPDYETYEQRFVQTAQAGLGEISKTLRPDLRAIWQAEGFNDVAEAQFHVRELGFKGHKDHTLAWLDGLENQNIELISDGTEDLGTYRDAVLSARNLGYLSEVEVGDRLRKFAVRYRSASVSEWFKSQPNRYEAAQALYDGDISNPRIQQLWDTMSEADRSDIFRLVIDDSSKLLTLQNQEREQRERAESDATKRAIKDFYFDPTLDDVGRAAIFNRVFASPSADASTLQGMETFVREGGQLQDIEADVLAAERMIQRGEVQTDAELTQAIGRDDLRISFETMRTRLLPMIEAQSDETFVSVLRWGQAELGIITGAGVLGDIFKDPVDKAAKFEADLRRFKKENPTGDLWGYAEKQVGLLKTQANVAATRTLPIMTTQYREALASGDAETIANTRQALITILIEAGLVDPVQAARSDFDPLTVIEGDAERD